MGHQFNCARAHVGDLGWAQLVVPFFFEMEGHNAIWCDMLHELALNAFEHGTQYCSTGAVRAFGVVGSTGAVFGVDQSPSTVMATALQARISGSHREDFQRTRLSGREGGVGIWKAAISPEAIEVNFEDVEGGE